MRDACALTPSSDARSVVEHILTYLCVPFTNAVQALGSGSQVRQLTCLRHSYDVEAHAEPFTWQIHGPERLEHKGKI